MHLETWTSFILFLSFCVDPINGGWTGWTSWFPCSASCGGGIQISSRYCTKPYPSRGGKHCVGPSVKKQICNPQHCPCKYCAVAFLIYMIYIPITDVRTTAKLWRTIRSPESYFCQSFTIPAFRKCQSSAITRFLIN